MGRIRNTVALAAIGAALTAANASAAETGASVPAPPPAPPSQPASTTTEPAKPLPDLGHGETIAAPEEEAEKEAPKQAGGTSVGGNTKPAAPKPPKAKPAPQPAPEETGGTAPAPINPPSLSIPSLPSSSCASSGIPPILVPIYQRAAQAYGLGPQGPAVLAGINQVETDFGTNLNVSSAGAVGWMQFMPSTWETYGVDANGDGVADPYNPEDAIFAAARYLSAAGMPADTYGAIYAYNHASWYVQEVLANASCYGGASGASGIMAPAASLEPKLQQLTCHAAPAWSKQIPAEYLSAFEQAAARYELGKRGVWALAAVARLESNFGRDMSRRQLAHVGPLGLERGEWERYAVDGNHDGHIQHSSPADSAATLARLIWSRGSLRAGIFTHNQAEWYVEAVMNEAARMEGACKIRTIEWSIALPKAATSYVNPFSLGTEVVTGRVDQGVDFTGTGPIVAIGNAVVLRTGAPGWPEGGGVLYQLLDGPLKGEVIFVYEGVDATVQPGQRVKAGEQIATFRPGGSIETGFSDTAGVPLSHTEYYEGKVTQSGLEMLSLLQSLGV
jgi:soluble lytic murein transglycosylase-like protein/murein DD-endopeptidase MepM/ murein hydrolase activator NlpD